MVRESPGPRPSISISPVPDLGLRPSRPTPRPAPNDSVIVSGTFMDANPSATLTATINWGDGSAPTVVDLPAGSYAFAAPHDYTTDPASGVVHDRRDLERHLRRDRLRADDRRHQQPGPGLRRARPGALVVQHRSKGARSTSAERSSAPAASTPTRSSLDWGDGSTPTTIVLARARTRSRQPIPI